MISNFETKYIAEPDLVFGNQGEDKDPRTGLDQHGPYFYTTEDANLVSRNAQNFFENTIQFQQTLLL